ncbi:MAG: hypothetical protein ACTSWN_11100 [Promethearchaeota archaeon]
MNQVVNYNYVLRILKYIKLKLTDARPAKSKLKDELNKKKKIRFLKELSDFTENIANLEKTLKNHSKKIKNSQYKRINKEIDKIRKMMGSILDLIAGIMKSYQNKDDKNIEKLLNYIDKFLEKADEKLIECTKLLKKIGR